MHEFYEFRVQEKYAHILFADVEGERLDGADIRKVILRDDDARLAEVGRVTQEVRATFNDSFFFGWDIRRNYGSTEIQNAETFHLELVPSFEPAGEECGTVYDYGAACPICGAGRRQVSNLVLDLRKIPKSRDITSTIADEWIVSQRLASLMLKAGITGFELRPVQHKARYQDDPIYYERLPTGRQILEMTEQMGMKYLSWEFTVWINSPEQRELVQQIDREQAERGERRDRRRGKPLPLWYQLVVTGSAGATIAPTTFGIEPFNYDEKGAQRCPEGHVSGLNLLSEVTVARSAWDGGDLCVTTNLVGCRRGLLVPRPLLLVTPRFWSLLRDNGLKAYRFDVAHLA